MADWPYCTPAWRKLRMMKLQMQPLCEHCRERGQLVPASHVDHILAIAKGGEAFPELDGLAALCAPCHNSKTMTFDRGRGEAKPFARRFKGFDANGNPLDKRDAWHGGGGSDR